MSFEIPEDNEEIAALELVEIPLDVDLAVSTYSKMVSFVKKVLVKDTDYGTIPGTGKPSLWKPGAEKMRRFFGLYTETMLTNKEERWDTPITETTFPLFSYDYTTIVKDGAGKIIATTEGNCNSYEDKYRWRYSSTLPVGMDASLIESEPWQEFQFAFAIKKKETSGKYGKPIEYWEEWEKDIADGTATRTQKPTKNGMSDAYERAGVRYRVPNGRIFDQINTIKKMSQKRSFVGAILIATGGSEFFTQDLEDYAQHLGEENSIYMLVPDKTSASRQLIAYVKGRGVADANNFIKDTFEAEQFDFTLDAWQEAVTMLDSKIDSLGK